jgi:competence ComEA-like helix-hairpin-helix protein
VTAARAALALLCVVAAAAPAAAQTAAPGLGELYERYPVEPRRATTDGPAPGGRGARPADDGGAPGGIAPEGLAAAGALAAIALGLVGASTSRHRRRDPATPSPARWRRAMVPTVDDHDGLIDLASATEADLCRLVGVGPALAKNIVDWREENGGFASVDELAGIKGIGEGRLELLRPQVFVGDAPRARRAAPAEPADAPGAGEAAGAADDVVLDAERVRVAPRRALARRRLPAVLDAPGRDAEGGRNLAAFLRENSVNVALVGLAVAAQLLVIVLVVWVL